MRRNDICLYLAPDDRAQLQALLTNRNTARKLVWRAEIVLSTADGWGTNEIRRRANTSKPTVWRWQARYLDEGIDGLRRDKTRPSRVPPLPRETRLKVIAKTVQETPPNATHWSRALMAEAVGISPSSVGRIWAEAGLKPHLIRGFKVSNDPMFEEKVTEIVGLYLDPPERAVVLCVDEKSQIQALDHCPAGHVYMPERGDPTGAAPEKGPCRDNDPRLQAQWHDHAVCGARRKIRRGHRRMSAAPPAARQRIFFRCARGGEGIPALLAPH